MRTNPEQVAAEIHAVLGDAVDDLEFGLLVDRVVAYRLLASAELADVE